MSIGLIFNILQIGLMYLGLGKEPLPQFFMACLVMLNLYLLNNNACMSQGVKTFSIIFCFMILSFLGFVLVVILVFPVVY